MATKNEILKKIQDNIKSTKPIACFYTFDEGFKVKLSNIEQNLELIDKQLVDGLIDGIKDESSLEIASLLYYRAFVNLTSQQYSNIQGVVTVDKNLYSEENKDNAKTGASAAFSPLTNDVFIREGFLSGTPETIANDMISLLHETRHYFQHIEEPIFTRHINKPDEGIMSEHNLFAQAFKSFGIQKLFPQASVEQISDLSYAVYHQNPIEKDARAYSLQVAHSLISKALATKNLSAEQNENLTRMLTEVNTLMQQEVKDNAQYGKTYQEIQQVVNQKAEQVLSQVDTVLTSKNISKLEHYSERNPETEDIRQFIFDVEKALLIKYDPKVAKLLEHIILTYDIYAVGRTLIQNPKHKPNPKVVDTVIKQEALIKIGINNIPAYNIDEVIDRYAELNADLSV